VAAAVIATVITSPALAQRAPQQPEHSSNPAYDVYVNGQYVGSDPDPNIRASCSAAIRAVSGRRGANRAISRKGRNRVGGLCNEKIRFGISIMARPGDTCRRERTAAATPTV